MTVEGDLINRCELFDETDLDAALARFDELSRPAPRLENTASRVDDRFVTLLRDPGLGRDGDSCWPTKSPSTIAGGVVNGGVHRGRDMEIANMRVVRRHRGTHQSRPLMAIRGERLALSRTRFSGRDQGPDGFHGDILGIIEIDADERIVAHVAFDPDDIDAAFAELDARYLAGEAAPYAETWSVIPKHSPRSSGANRSPRRRTGYTLTIARWRRSRQAIWRHTSVPHGISRPTSASTSRPCIAWVTSERWSPTWRTDPQKRASRVSGEMTDFR